MWNLENVTVSLFGKQKQRHRENGHMESGGGGGGGAIREEGG